ncbi:MAG: anhydro-N-acetylmuramic acid kinase [Neomegalonema sp.]|nr:anhydro-N-acetylmuramic acid kinase [Neomegalonema sp.]
MSDAQMRWVLGFMSGTSLDGVDAAVLQTDGEAIAGFGPTSYRAYTPQEHESLQQALVQAAKTPLTVAMDPTCWRAEAQLVAQAHLDCAAQLRSGGASFDLAGFHGQTLLHRPDDGATLQIGDARGLADGIGASVVHDFRSADIAAGGQGAPFASFYHFALARFARLDAPCAFLNMGGVGNVTFVDPSADRPEAPGALLAFDTGPANAPVDDFVRARGAGAYDKDGALAQRGRLDGALVSRWVAQSPYLAAPAPKSLDRNDFAGVLADLDDHTTEDGAATLVDFAAACVAEAVRFAPQAPSRWFVCGGGRRNQALMARLGARLGAPVLPVEAIGVDGDFVEAQAFAYLAARSVRGLPLSAPGTTGCPLPVSGGRLIEPAGG